jgi:hypothetical protein
MSLSKSETKRVAIPAGRLLLKKVISKNSGWRSARGSFESGHLTFSDRSGSAY